MPIYCAKVSELMGLSGNEIVQRMEAFCSDNSASEKKSWRNSLPKLISVIQSAGLGNLYIATEYEYYFFYLNMKYLKGYLHIELLIVFQIYQYI